ncbi:MAG: PqqD family protein [Bacteroidota bacterium]
MSTSQEITETSVIQRNEAKFLASALGEEIVMMNTDNGDYIGINSVGSDIWNLLTEPMRIDQLIAEVGAMYDVDAEELKTEINTFLQRMLKQDMIVVNG